MPHGLCTHGIAHHPLQQFVAAQRGRRPEQQCVCSLFQPLARGSLKVRGSGWSPPVGTKEPPTATLSKSRESDCWLQHELNENSRGWTATNDTFICSEIISDASVSMYILADCSQERLITGPWANMTNFISGKKNGKNCNENVFKRKEGHWKGFLRLKRY